MATRDPVKNSVYFGFIVLINQNEVADPHFLLLENN